MRFSCIIPAYNEGPRIRAVIETVLDCPLLDEIIIVDDGSTDETRTVIEQYRDPRLRVITQKNTGKTRAIVEGIHISTGSHIVMIDADLIGLHPDHIVALIQPVRDHMTDVTISIRENSLWIYHFFGTDFVSGERVLPRSIFDDVSSWLSAPGFALEVLINAQIMRGHLHVKNIFLVGVLSPHKSTKSGFIHGTLADWRMIGEILSVISIGGLLSQLWYLSRFSHHEHPDAGADSIDAAYRENPR